MHVTALAPVEAALSWCTPLVKGFALIVAFFGLAIQFGRQTTRRPIGEEYSRLSNMLFAGLAGGIFTFLGLMAAQNYLVDAAMPRDTGLGTAGTCFGIAVVALGFIIAYTLSWKRYTMLAVAASMVVVMTSMVLDYAVEAKLMSIPQVILNGIEVGMFIGLALGLVAWAIKARTKQVPAKA